MKPRIIGLQRDGFSKLSRRPIRSREFEVTPGKLAERLGREGLLTRPDELRRRASKLLRRRVGLARSPKETPESDPAQRVPRVILKGFLKHLRSLDILIEAAQRLAREEEQLRMISTNRKGR